MTRLIDADALKNDKIYSEDRHEYIVPVYNIDNAPTVEERLKGEWESVGFRSMKYAWCRCSNCHKTTKIFMDSSNDFCCIADIRKKAIACLFCGAKMEN